MRHKSLSVLIFLSLLLLCACNQFDPGCITEFTIDDNLPMGSGQNVKVIILSGQSNATGCSHPEYLESDPSYSRYASGFDSVLISYMTENSNTANGFVPVKFGQGAAGILFGPEIGMAEVLSAAYPDETVYIVKYSYGGASLKYDFDPIGKGPLYKSLLAFVDANLQYLESKNYNPQVIGFCWMQGESDSIVGCIESYHKLQTRLFNKIRSRYRSYASSEGIRIADAGISEIWSMYPATNLIKKQISCEMENVVFIDTISEGLTTRNEPTGSPDIAHYDAASEIKLGRLFAQAILR